MNIVDSCGWLEYIANGSNAAFFQDALADEAQLLLPPLVVFEVIRRLKVQGQDFAIEPTTTIMRRLQRAELSADQLAQAALAAHSRKLAQADAIIWQTAQSYGATLYTQDADLQGLPGVAYQAKPIR